MDRFSRLCLWGAMACAFLSLALLSFDVFPWFRDPVLPHRPTYPLGIAGMALFILSGQWRGRMKEHLLLLGGISGLAVLAALQPQSPHSVLCSACPGWCRGLDAPATKV